MGKWSNGGIATLLNIWSAISFHDERGWNQENSLGSYQYKDKRWLVEGQVSTSRILNETWVLPVKKKLKLSTKLWNGIEICVPPVLSVVT